MLNEIKDAINKHQKVHPKKIFDIKVEKVEKVQ
jgi:hypothetical protein